MRRPLLRGFAWQGSSHLIARASRLLVWLVLGGILSPAEFGAFAAIYVVVDGLYLLQEMGLPQALLVRTARVGESADTTFFLAAALGVIFATAGFVLAPWVAGFYGDPALAAPLRVLSAVLVVHALRVVPLRLFERDLRFDRKVAPTAWGAGAYVATTLAGGFAGLGLWALVAGVLAGAAAETLAYWVASPWRPSGRFHREIAREDLAFGLPIVAASVLAYAYGSVDRLVLGRWGGPDVLGPYAFALTIALVPSSVGAAIVNGVLLPAYRAVGAGAAPRRELHWRAVSLTAGLNLLFAALMLAAGPGFLRAVYGTKWDAAFGPLLILPFAGVFRGLASLTGDFLVASTRPSAYRTVNTVHLVAAAALIGPAIHVRGAEGVALAMTAAAAVAVASSWLLAARSLEVAAHRFIPVVAPAATAFAAAASAGAGLRAMVPAAGIPALALHSAVCIAVFLAVWAALDLRLRRLFRREVGA